MFISNFMLFLHDKIKDNFVYQKVTTPFQGLIKSISSCTNDLPRSYLTQEQQLSLTDKKRLIIDAALADWPNHRNQAQLDIAATYANKPLSWRLERTLTAELAKKLSENDLFANMENIFDHGLLLDQSSGLVVYIFHNPEDKKIRLLFGGTGSGKYAGPLLLRGLANLPIHVRQWQANLDNVFQKIPQNYQQADLLVAQLQALLRKHSIYHDYAISVSGHSKGGAEAAYAALMNSSNEIAIEAHCFGSAELGEGIWATIQDYLSFDKTQVETASKNIFHYFVDGDIVPYIGKIFNRQLKHVGNVVQLPQGKHAGKWPILSPHNDFFQHAIDYFEDTQKK